MINEKFDYVKYHKDVMNDYKELKKHYPYTTICILPSSKPTPIEIRVIAASNELIKNTSAVEKDFLGAFSKELNIIVPFNYKKEGCKVYGAKWLKKDMIREEDWHFYSEMNEEKKLFCVGVPMSFSNLSNVILENVRTADNMLTAYEQVQKGLTDRVNLIAYSHGVKGKKEYEKNKKRYKS